MDCASRAVEERVPLSVKCAEVAGTSGSGAAEIQNVHLRERVFLAWTQRDFS